MLEVTEEIRAYMKNATMRKYLAQQQFDGRVNIRSYFGNEFNANDSSSSLPPQSISGARESMNQ